MNFSMQPSTTSISPLISVVIPTCNRAELLAKCLQCLAPEIQTLARDQYEVIVTDDSSSGVEVEKSLSSGFPWVKWVRGPRRGPASNRNRGARHARGDWLVFLDDDCLPAPQLLKAYANQFDGKSLALEGAIHSAGDVEQDMAECPVNTTGGLFWSANIAVERALFEGVGGFDPSYPIAAHEDQDLFIRLSARTSVQFVSEARVSHEVRIAPWWESIAKMPSMAKAWALHSSKHRRHLGYTTNAKIVREGAYIHLRACARNVLSGYLRRSAYHLVWATAGAICTASALARLPASASDSLGKVVRILPPALRRQKLLRLLITLVPWWRYSLLSFNGSGRAVIDLTDANARNCFRNESFEPDFFEIALPFLREGGVLLDIGANFGLCSFGLIDLLPGADIQAHLFEANQGLCDCLRASAAMHPNSVVDINHCCVTERPGISRLSINDGDLGSSFIAQRGEHEVPNLVLDLYLSERGIEGIRFVKLDIEGFEVSALRGASRSLQSGKLPVIYFEVSGPNLGRQGLAIEDCLQLLRSAGFTLYFCKVSDLSDSPESPHSGPFLQVSGIQIPVRPIDGRQLPPGYQGDLLAIHASVEEQYPLSQRK